MTITKVSGDDAYDVQYLVGTEVMGCSYIESDIIYFNPFGELSGPEDCETIPFALQ